MKQIKVLGIGQNPTYASDLDNEENGSGSQEMPSFITDPRKLELIRRGSNGVHAWKIISSFHHDGLNQV